MYLGDGCISRHPRAYKLRVFQDARYPNSIQEIREAVSVVRGCDLERVRTVAKVGCVEVYTYWKHWPCVFPQHGLGLKNRREITFEPWQVEIVETNATRLLRGLIHSDGCRFMNRVSKGKYAYPRYFFTNTSPDILQIFRNACDTAGIGYRDSRWNAISIARRDDVASLDAFVGPKT